MKNFGFTPNQVTPDYATDPLFGRTAEEVITAKRFLTDTGMTVRDMIELLNEECKNARRDREEIQRI